MSIAYATVEYRERVPARLVLVVGLAVGYGTAIELVQWTLPDRYFGLGDLVANAVGGLLATGWLLAERYVAYVDWPDLRGRISG